jgi:hypothetical protein
MKTKLQLKEQWKQYLKDNPQLSKTINKHHYLRTRKASSFWIKEIELIYQEVKELSNLNH